MLNCIWLFANFVFSVTVYGQEDLVALATNFCNSESSCSSKNGTVVIDADSCCRPCSCDTYCHERGTCCPDSVQPDPSKNIVQQSCLVQMYVPPGKRYYGMELSAVYVRDKCPIGYQDERVKNLCELEAVPESYLDVLFVTTSDGRVTYRNRHCAKCHGVEDDIVDWDIEIDKTCAKYHFFEATHLSLQNVSSILLECMLYFKRPSVFFIEEHFCYLDHDSKVKRRCNVTGNMNNINVGLETMCLTENTGIFYVGSTIYYNVYCYLCNVQINQTVRSCEGILFFDTKTLPYLVLLDFNTVNQRVASGITEPCAVDHIYDHFFSKCRPLLCPLMNVAVYGSCYPFDTGYTGFEYTVNAELTSPSSNSGLFIPTKTSEWYKLRTFVKYYLQLSKCSLCSFIPYVISNEVIEMQLAIYTGKDCPRSDILSSANECEVHPVTFAFPVDDNYTVVYRLRCIETLSTPRHTVGNSNCRTFSASRLANCNNVWVSNDDFNTINSTHPKAGSLLVKAVEAETDTLSGVYLCTEEYLNCRLCNKTSTIRPYVWLFGVLLCVVLLQANVATSVRQYSDATVTIGTL